MRARKQYHWKRVAERLLSHDSMHVSFGNNVRTWAQGVVYGCVASEHKPPEVDGRKIWDDFLLSGVGLVFDLPWSVSSSSHWQPTFSAIPVPPRQRHRRRGCCWLGRVRTHSSGLSRGCSGADGRCFRGLDAAGGDDGTYGADDTGRGKYTTSPVPDHKSPSQRFRLHQRHLTANSHSGHKMVSQRLSISSCPSGGVRKDLCDVLG